MSRRIEVYKVKRGDNLAVADFWNQRFEDLDLRLATREDDADSIEAAIANLEAVGLQRITDTFTPLVLEAQEALNSYGISFAAHSTTSLSIGLGEKILTLDEETRNSFYYAAYVNLRYDANNSMLGSVTSYVRATGILTINVIAVAGSGTHAAWDVNLGAAPDTTHSGRTDNPHQTTAAQVGAYTIAQTDTAIDNAIGALPPISTALLKASNLADLPDKLTARSNLGLGSLAVEDEVGSGMFSTSAFGAASPVVIDGGTF